ncbi:MAG: hypothetical protein JWO38_1197 [Gemmataceae bacterium]|nr:hypothetical protein [Gemmataceae bacterium]
MSAPFTDEDKAFLRRILNNPAELTGWLIYADWLDERDHPLRAEFLRLQVRQGQLGPDDPDRPGVDARLRVLRLTLPRLWVAVFDRPAIENCTADFAFRCPGRWENLKVIGEVGERYCESCEQLVYYCHDISQARNHARLGHCVAVSLAETRSPRDLEVLWPEEMMMGLMIADPDPPPPPRRPWWKFW